MSKIIAASIDLNKLDKTRIVTGKNGAKYYNITLICNDEPDQYQNDVAVTTGQTKEERLAKAKATYIGNGRTVFDSEKGNSKPEFKSIPADNDDLPF